MAEDYPQSEALGLFKTVCYYPRGTFHYVFWLNGKHGDIQR